jgi:hypothetical protein
LKHPLFLALASACTLAAAIGATSCKSNDIQAITNNNNETFVAQTDQMVGPTGAIVNGPDGSQASIPPKALVETKQIVVGKLSGGFPALPTGWASTSPGGAGAVYAFEPHGTPFGLPVTLKVPYVDPGTPIRLVTAEPGGAWTPVDNIPLANGFATAQVTQFSYFAVVTGDGAEPPPLSDGGADAETDATTSDVTTVDSGADTSTIVDSGMPVEAAPPPAPALFAMSSNELSTSTPNAIYRFQITPSTIIPPDGGASDASTPSFGVFGDAGTYAIADGGAIPTSIAMGNTMGGAPYTLFVGGQFVLQQPDAGGAVVSVTDPFGSPAFGGGFPASVSGAMTFSNGELWVPVGSPPQIETFVNGAANWGQGGNIMPGGQVLSAAIEPTKQVLYLVVSGSPNTVQRWQLGGSGSTKTASSIGIAQLGLAGSPTAVTIAPWGEVLLEDQDGGTVYRFDSTGTNTGSFRSSAGQASSLAVVHWPGSPGVDEMFETGYMSGIYRTVLDANHNPVGNGSFVSFSAFVQVLVAP